MAHKDFKSVALPCYARNHLENGISQNLFYEEVVPHQSVFTLIVGADSSDDLSKFRSAVNDQVIQFGGDATIGCGYCLLTEIDSEVLQRE